MQLETIVLLILYYYINEVFTGQNVRRKLLHGCCVKVWFALSTVVSYYVRSVLLFVRMSIAVAFIPVEFREIAKTKAT